VGTAARRQAAHNTANTFYSVKRLMGRSWDEVQGLGLIYTLHKTQDGGVELACPARDATLTPQQVGLKGTCVFNTAINPGPSSENMKASLAQLCT
jgi:molecular chaperone DnaK (HSP70)